MNLRTRIIDFCFACTRSIRPVLGPGPVCIYPIDCQAYAQATLANRSIFIAVPLIALRLLSCNPITGLFNQKS